jgi:hypothetical protein
MRPPVVDSVPAGGRVTGCKDDSVERIAERNIGSEPTITFSCESDGRPF